MISGADCDKVQVLENTEENGPSWTVSADLPAARHQAASCVHAGRIWLLGGFFGVDDDGDVADDPTASVSIYDASDGWTTGPALPRGMFDCRAVSRDGEIFIAGTCFDEYTHYYEFCAFVYRNAWVEVVDLPGDDIADLEIQNLLLG